MKTTEIAFAIELLASLKDPDLQERLVALHRAKEDADTSILEAARREGELAERAQQLELAEHSLQESKDELTVLQEDLALQQASLAEFKSMVETSAKAVDQDQANRHRGLQKRASEIEAMAEDLVRREDRLTAASIELAKREQALAQKHENHEASKKEWDHKLSQLKQVLGK